MTADLFEEMPLPDPPRRANVARQPVAAALHDATIAELASAVPAALRLGTSSWSFPGWEGLVWAGTHSEAQLAKQGLAAYAQHPMFRAVSLDRSFYRPLSASQYAAYAAQVPDDFRFVVKAPNLVTDALVRGGEGRATQPNPAFLSPALAVSEFVQPALEGLGHKVGVLVFQLSPLPRFWLDRMPEVFERVARMLDALPKLDRAAGAVVAVEVRDAQFLIPEFAAVLRAAGATYCLGLHAKLPPLQAQLPMLRALWPGPLVCRWSLHRKHGTYGYEAAKQVYEPFDQLMDPDPDTRNALARVIVATIAAGFHAFVTINNKAEGSAPLSVVELAKAVARDAGESVAAVPKA